MNCPKQWPFLISRNHISRSYPVVTGSCDGRNCLATTVRSLLPISCLVALCLLWSHEGCLSFCTSMCPCGPDSLGCSAQVQEYLSGQMCPPSPLPNVSPDCTSQGPWKWTIGFVLPTILDESQDGCCGLFPQLRKRKMIHVKRRHKKTCL